MLGALRRVCQKLAQRRLEGLERRDRVRDGLRLGVPRLAAAGEGNRPVEDGILRVLIVCDGDCARGGLLVHDAGARDPNRPTSTNVRVERFTIVLSWY